MCVCVCLCLCLCVSVCACGPCSDTTGAAQCVLQCLDHVTMTCTRTSRGEGVAVARQADGTDGQRADGRLDRTLTGSLSSDQWRSCFHSRCLPVCLWKVWECTEKSANSSRLSSCVGTDLMHSLMRLISLTLDDINLIHP